MFLKMELRPLPCANWERIKYINILIILDRVRTLVTLSVSPCEENLTPYWKNRVNPTF